MSVRFMFTDKDDNPLKDMVQICGCWGFLKGMPSALSNQIRLRDREGGKACRGVNYYGIPVGEGDKVEYLRVYTTTRARDVSYKYEGIESLYDAVLSEVPTWFKDFTLKRGENNQYYLLVSMSASSLRNYNALRMIRNLLYIPLDTIVPDDPMDTLITTEFCYASNGVMHHRRASSDSQCIPMILFDSYESSFEAIERGPILSNTDTPLNIIIREPLVEKYGNYFMARAFLEDTAKLNNLIGCCSIKFDGKEIKDYPLMVKQLNKRRAA